MARRAKGRAAGLRSRRRARRASSVPHRDEGKECDGGLDFSPGGSCDAVPVPVLLWIAVALSAFASGAPLSGDAHQMAAEVLGIDEAGTSPLFAVTHIAAALALASVGYPARRQVPVIATILGLAGAEAFQLLSAAVRGSALTVGVGVLANAAMLASTRVAPGTIARGSALRDGLLGSATLALSGAPGASPPACALASRAWSGARRPLESAALVAIPFELRAAWSAWARADVPCSGGELAAACALSLPAAWVGARGRRLGLERLVTLAVPWLCVVGASLLAYAWAAR